MTPRQAALWGAVLAQRKMIEIRVGQRITGEDANDAVQLVLMKAAQLIAADRFIVAEGLDVTSAVRGWLTVILRYVCGNLRQAAASAERTHRALPREAMFVDPVPVLESREELRNVPRGLSPRDRETLDAFARCGGSFVLTAAEMGIPVGTVSTRIYEIRRYLKKRRALDK